jgi:16S rRNA (guanine1207-N2)-methyltransferase
MLNTRLTIALQDGGLALPEDGQILIIGPNAGHDLSNLPKDRVTVYARFFPDRAHWSNLGYTTINEMPDTGFCAALICMPRAKSLAQSWVFDATHATGGGLVIVDGQKTDGVDSLLKALKSQSEVLGTLSKAHGKIFWITGAQVEGWRAKDTTPAAPFITRPGVFSADAIDKGSAALSAAMPAEIKGRVADLGAGWGYLSHHILAREGVTSLDVIEADLVALNCAKENISDPRAQFFWQDATKFKPEALYDVVITNPPFHTTRAGDPDIGRTFIRAGAAMLKPAGRFVMVANRHLPYETTLTELFREVSELGGTSGFKILSGAKPRRKKV